MSAHGKGQKVRALATASSSRFSGAKVNATSSITQLAGYGYTWNQTVYDTDEYVAECGDFTGGTDYFDADATVFRVPTLAVYRVSAGVLLNTTDGNAHTTPGGITSFLTMNENFPTFSFNEFVNMVPVYYDSAGDVNEMGWAQNTWEGILDPEVDQMIGFYTTVSFDVPTHDRMLVGSWFAIHRLGTLP